MPFSEQLASKNASVAAKVPATAGQQGGVQMDRNLAREVVQDQTLKVVKHHYIEDYQKEVLQTSMLKIIQK